MKISVVVCTNREGDLLHQAIRSVLEQDLDPNDYEVILVDNHPEGYLQSFFHLISTDRDVPFRYVHEPCIGLSHARNTGATNSQGEWIVYIDDDAKLAPDSLSVLIQVFQTFPNLGAVAGKVKGQFESGTPVWWNELQTIFDLSVSVVDRGNESRFVKLPEWMCGACYAVRRDILLKLGGHDPNFGRLGHLLLGGEEVDLQMRIEMAGFQVRYEPNFMVYHYISQTKLTFLSYLRRQYWSGQTQLRFDRKYSTGTHKLNQLLYMLIRVPWSLMLAGLYLLFRKPGRAIFRLGQEFFTIGYIESIIKRM